MLVKYCNLLEKTKQEVKNSFVYWQWDATSKTFEEWANKHAFYVTKRCVLDNRYHHCEPDFMAEEGK